MRETWKLWIFKYQTVVSTRRKVTQVRFSSDLLAICLKGYHTRVFFIGCYYLFHTASSGSHQRGWKRQNLLTLFPLFYPTGKTNNWLREYHLMVYCSARNEQRPKFELTRSITFDTEWWFSCLEKKLFACGLWYCHLLCDTRRHSLWWYRHTCLRTADTSSALFF